MMSQDAKAIRERLNTVVTALVLLETDKDTKPSHADASAKAFDALKDIARLVTADEHEENGQHIAEDLKRSRARIRKAALGGREVAGRRR